MPWTTDFSIFLAQRVLSPQYNTRAPRGGEVDSSRVETEQCTFVQAFTERGDVGVNLQLGKETGVRDEVRVAENPKGQGCVRNVPTPARI